MPTAKHGPGNLHQYECPVCHHKDIWTAYQREEILLSDGRVLNVVICPVCRAFFKEW